jgi:hypothetical protein
MIEVLPASHRLVELMAQAKRNKRRYTWVCLPIFQVEDNVYPSNSNQDGKHLHKTLCFNDLQRDVYRNRSGRR